MVFGYLTGRGYYLDGWKKLDFTSFAMMIILMLKLNKNLFGEGNLIWFVDSKFFNTILHCVQLVLMWVRLLSVLITTKSYGPLLRMIYIISSDLDAFLLIYFTVIFGAATVVTSLFSN